jgi:hypothetical protein
MMAGHQRKIYQNDTGQSWWLCRHEEADAFILFEDRALRSPHRTSDQRFFNSELSRPAQQALLKLIGSLAVLKD